MDRVREVCLTCFSASLRQGDATRFSAGHRLAFLGFLGNLERSLLMSDPGIIQEIIQAVIDFLNSL